MQSRVGKRLGQTAKHGELPSVSFVLLLLRRLRLQFRRTAAPRAPIRLRGDQCEVVSECVCSESNGDASLYRVDGEPRGMAEVIVEEGSTGGHG